MTQQIWAQVTSPAMTTMSLSNWTVENVTQPVAPPSFYDVYQLHRPTVVSFDQHMTPLWYVIGFPGNALAICVWIQRRMRHSSGCYLAALALADFVFLVLQMLYEIHNVWKTPILNWPILCQVFPVCFLTSQYLSPLLVLGFTFERYISICHPFQRERFCTTSRAIKAICALTGFCVALHAVQAYFWIYDSAIQDCSPRPGVAESSTSLWSVWSWITELLVFGVVPVAILALNAFVIRETQRLRRKEQKDMSVSNKSPSASSSASGHHHHKSSSSPSATTFMLLVVSFYLIFTTLPVTFCYALFPQFLRGNETLSGAEIDNDPAWQRHLNYWSIKIVVQEVCMSHYACNVVIYLLTGRMFRQQLKRLLLCGGQTSAALSSASRSGASSRRRAVGVYYDRARTADVTCDSEKQQQQQRLVVTNQKSCS